MSGPGWLHALCQTALNGRLLRSARADQCQTQSIANGVTIDTQQFCSSSRGPERSVKRRIEPPGPAVSSKAQAADEVISQHQRCQKLPASRVLAFSHRQTNREYDSVGMNNTAFVKSVVIECTGEKAVYQRGRRCRKSATVNPNGAFPMAALAVQQLIHSAAASRIGPGPSDSQGIYH
jgi:hypothetical protein